MDTKIYQPVWNKYLPVIKIKLREAIKKNEAQVLSLDKLDFEKAGSRKNAAYQFNLEMKEGRAINASKTSAVGRGFANALNENEITKELVKTGHFTFTMGTKFILTLQKNEDIKI